MKSKIKIYLPLIVACFVIGFFCSSYAKDKYIKSHYISRVNNLLTTYYLNEPIDLTDVTIMYTEVVGGKSVNSIVPVTYDMIKGFDSTSTGIKKLKILYKSSTYDFTYYVKQTSTEKVTADSFTLGVFYNHDTVEATEHFNVYIFAGSYLPNNYKEIIEKIYQIEQEVTGLKFMDKINLQVSANQHPGSAGKTIYMDASELFAVESTVFQHELAHTLDYSQGSSFLPTKTLIEGFATYVEYLTSKKIHECYPEYKKYTNSHYGTICSVNFLSTQLYDYDFEKVILNLEQDEITANSPYEAGARFFAYLHHRYGDFCGWMKDENFKFSTLEEWKSSIKKYYKNYNVLRGFYSYEKSFGDKYNVFLGANNFAFYDKYHGYTNDFSCADKINYYFNFGFIKESQGKKTIIYKDLYINIDSAKDQLTKTGVVYSDLKLKTDKNIQIELYDSGGTLIETIIDAQEISVKNVSFIKLVGSGVVRLNLSYD